MSVDISSLEPKMLWKNFSALNEVPRASKKEERVIRFMLDFGNNLGLKTIKDHIGNVIISKPATPGMENKQTVVMQSHLDMVHQKNSDTVFDFDKEGIKMLIDGDWVKAEGTTLGADNGIGVATIMALLESTDIAHPALEALFTIDEETGMTGALELKGGLLTGSIMLNLDTEDDRELTIGCAGGIDLTSKGSYKLTPVDESFKSYKIDVKGLTGGHSGMDIHLGRGNANKIMNRILMEASKKTRMSLSTVNGGGLRNAIPRESFAVVNLKEEQYPTLEKVILDLTQLITTEHETTDPDFQVTISEVRRSEFSVEQNFAFKLMRSIYTCPNGIYRMSPDIKDLVQTSNNLARVFVKNGKYEILCLTRSSVESEKHDLANAITACFELSDAKVERSGSYPGWQPKPNADIVKLMTQIYKDKFNEEPHVNACHAGLECGILGQNYPDMDMISFGPNIRGAHSPDEKVQISSVQKYWDFLLDTLKQIPENA
ncbi:MAG: aminoacyl-histidine dipeptidase [Saprospiraceae bacterium]|nr:aminoacyl-histidine dipeptidase [Bacteroidia bacterium]NNL90710.1 aminoacyl-histidine dipeptidase [Saprospiraceae bacterium]